jgi:RNA polymerase sigma-70 factor (ECF subfamily)
MTIAGDPRMNATLQRIELERGGGGPLRPQTCDRAFQVLGQLSVLARGVVATFHDSFYERKAGFLTDDGRFVDDAAFDRLFSEHAEPLLSFLVMRTGDRALAEDLVADTFERALRRRRLFDRRRGTEKAWLYTIAVNLLRDNARRRATEQRVLAEAPAGRTHTQDLAEEAHRRTSVLEALEALTTEEREAVALRFGGDLSVPEMAVALDVPLTTMEGRLYRALRKLRTELGERP